MRTKLAIALWLLGGSAVLWLAAVSMVLVWLVEVEYAN
jgi:hypothetical protein